MSPVHIHLLLNHVPILATIFGVVILIVALMRRSSELQATALAFFLGAALFAIPVYLTGEPAEETVEHIAGVSHDAIHEHEDAAEYAFIAMEVLGAVSLLGLILFRRMGRPVWYRVVVLLVALFATSTIVRTGYLGGLIRHPETGASASAADDHEEEDGRGRNGE